uniref:NR LBD domain-containing protein n=1 Tax=Parastrongyloides trichosuri TaxID=131310 RepID=A0A0N4ZAA5_PARTI
MDLNQHLSYSAPVTRPPSRQNLSLRQSPIPSTVPASINTPAANIPITMPGVNPSFQQETINRLNRMAEEIANLRRSQSEMEEQLRILRDENEPQVRKRRLVQHRNFESQIELDSWRELTQSQRLNETEYVVRGINLKELLRPHVDSLNMLALSADINIILKMVRFNFDDPIFINSEKNVLSFAAEWIMLCRRYQLSDNCSNSILSFINKCFNGIQELRIPTTHNTIMKIVEDSVSENPFNGDIVGTSCKHVTFKLEPQLRQIIRYYFNDLLESYNDDYIGSPLDCDLYRRMKNDLQSDPLNKDIEKFIPLSIDSDGISISNSSKISLWPVFISILSLPLNIASSQENNILAAIYIGSSKPNFNEFFRDVVDNLKNLMMKPDYFQRNEDCDQRSYLCFPMTICGDLPFLSAALNWESHLSMNACFKCKTQVTTLTGSRHYPQTDCLLHTEQKYNQNLNNLMIGQSSNMGIKGPTILNEILKIPTCICIDYMHTSLECTFRRLLQRLYKGNEIFGKVDASKSPPETALSDYENIVSYTKLPKCFTRRFKLLTSFSEFKAGDLKLALLFSIPAWYLNLSMTTSAREAECILLYTETMRLFLRDIISNEQINEAESLIRTFLDMKCIVLEGKNHFTNHLHLHFGQQIRNTGPLVYSSTFRYESFGSTVANHITANNVVHGIRQLQKRLSNMYVASKYLRKNEMYDSYSSISYRYSERKLITINEDHIRYNFLNDLLHQILGEPSFNCVLPDVCIWNWANWRNHIVESRMEKKTSYPRDSVLVVEVNNVICPVLVEYIMEFKDELYFVCRMLDSTPYRNIFETIKNPIIKKAMVQSKYLSEYNFFLNNFDKVHSRTDSNIDYSTLKIIPNTNVKAKCAVVYTSTQILALEVPFSFEHD